MSIPEVTSPQPYRRAFRRLPMIQPTSHPRCGCCGVKVKVESRRNLGPVSVSFPCSCPDNKDAGRRCYRCEHCTEHCSCGPDLARIRGGGL